MENGKGKGGERSHQENGHDTELSDLANVESKSNKESEMKFISSEGAVNGDAKIDIENLKSAFAGLTKEELLCYVNDPFWVRTRFILFALFWLIWILMFAVAIGVVIMAPRCVASKPKTWYQVGPLYEIDVPKLAKSSESSQLEDLSKNLDYFNSIHVKALLLSNVLKSDENQAVVDFKAIDPNLGTLDQFKELVAKAKAKNVHIVLKFVPDYTSDHHIWFNKSIANENSYYVWQSPSGQDLGGNKLPPNNWLSVKGGSAWKWNDIRQKYYLHQFSSGQPELNFRDANLKKEFSDIFQHWLDIGVSGFSLDRVQYLLEDGDFENETLSRTATSATPDEYEFYNHAKTYNHPDTASLLIEWRDFLHSKNPDVLMITSDATPMPQDSNATTTVTDLSIHRKFLPDHGKPMKATQLAKSITDFQMKSELSDSLRGWPALQLTTDSSTRVAKKYGQEFVDPIMVITQFLSGTPVIYFGEELGLSEDPQIPLPWINSSSIKANNNKHLELFKIMADLRQSQSIMHGLLNVTVLNNTLLLTRIKHGSPGYAFIYNTGPFNETLSLSQWVAGENAEVTKIAETKDGEYVPSTEGQQKSTEFASRISIAPASLKVLTFVPASDSADA